MTLSFTNIEMNQLTAEKVAARDAFGEKIYNSLTDTPDEWELHVVFEQQRLLHVPSGLAIALPFDAYMLHIVDGPSIPIDHGGSAIRTRIGQVIASKQTAKLEGTE